MKTTTKTIIFLLISTILLSITLPIYANEIQVTSVVQTQSITKTFSLETAIKYALENSTMQAINKTRLEAAKLSLDEQKLAQYKLLDKGAYVFEGVKVRNGYYVRLSQMGLLLAEKGIIQTDAIIRFSTESVYFAYQNALDKKEICDNILLFAQDNQKTAKLRGSLGLASDIDLMYASNGVLKATIDKMNADNSLDYARMEFNKALGLPFDTKIELTDKIACVKYDEVNIAEKSELATANRMEAISAKEQLELDKKLLEVTGKYYMPNTYGYKQAQFTAMTSEDTYKSTLDTLRLSVYKAYNDMVNAFALLELLDAQISQQQKVYDIAKIKYAQGISANSEVTDALNKLLEAKLNKAQAMLGYNLAKTKFTNSYNIGLGI